MKPYNILVKKLFNAVSSFLSLPNHNPLVVFAEGPDVTDGNSTYDYSILKDDRAVFFIKIVCENAELFKTNESLFSIRKSCSSFLRKTSYQLSYAHSCTPRNLRRWMNNTVGRKKRCRIELCVLIYCWAIGWGSEDAKDEIHRECQKKISVICNQVLQENYTNKPLIQSIWGALEKAYIDSLPSSAVIT